jgi:secreted trypsin-like serine protease
MFCKLWNSLQFLFLKVIFLQGDSGSPVFIQLSRGYYVAMAIASFFSSNGCESTDPSGYTKVFPYNDWIRNITENPL